MMGVFRAACLFSLVLAGRLAAEVTPLEMPLPEEAETRITCELTRAPKRSEVPFFTSQKEAEATLGVYHYVVYIPKGYDAEPKTRWPVLFIMSHDGRADMDRMEDYLKQSNLVVVMLWEAKGSNEPKFGGWPRAVGNFLAAHDDVIKRVRIDETRKYATGFNGGARGASIFVQTRPGFVGLILQSAGLAADANGAYHAAGLSRNPKLYIAMTMGSQDHHRDEIAKTAASVASGHFKLFEFEGGHVPAWRQVFTDAMGWLRERAEPKPATSPALKPLF